MENAIRVNSLTKVFQVPEKPKSNLDRFFQLFRRRWNTFTAVDNISFTVERGEFLGLLGPNGSGKTTTIKMLSGVLTPSSGDVEVLGYRPCDRKTEFLKKLGVLFGNRSVLWYEIALEDSFLFYKELYGLSDSFYDNRMKLLMKLLDLKDILHIPVRKLSFGQRMRGEIGVSFLHRPEVVFLDEPTIGLDPLCKEDVHKFLREINKRDNVTIVLTTHNIDDIEELCKRIIVMSRGGVIYNGNTMAFKKRYVKYKDVLIDYIKVKNLKFARSVNSILKKIRSEGTILTGRVHIRNQGKLLNLLIKAYDVKDFELKEPPLESIIREVYRVEKAKPKEKRLIKKRKG